MMYGTLLHSQVGCAQDFVKRVSFAVSLTVIWCDYIDCAYLFSAAKFSRTVSADAELVSRQTQLIRFSAVLQETDRIRYGLIKRTLIKHAITVGGILHAS